MHPGWIFDNFWKFTIFFKIQIFFSRLAGLTNSNPVYFLTETPNHGKIKRIVQASNVKLEKRSVREREVWQFTHEDIKNGVIYFIAKPEMQISGNDSFRYRLEAPGVQPANGIFSFGISINTEATKTISNPITEDVTGVDNEESVPTEIVMTISAIFIIIAILIVIVFVIRFKRARDAARSKCTAPNNTKLNGDTTMTGAHVGNPYGTIQRCGSASLRTSRPINNGFATLEQHPHNTLRYHFRLLLMLDY